MEAVNVNDFNNCAYDIASHIKETYPSESELFKNANYFLSEYEKLGEIVGDNDNPFNPIVAQIIDLEEKYLSTF
jgi:hypothetical protein